MNEQANRRHPIAAHIGRGLVILVSLAIVVSIVADAIGNLTDGITAGEWATVGFVVAFFAIIAGAVLVSALKDRHPWAQRLAERGGKVRDGVVKAYFGLLGMCVYAIVLLAAFATGFNQWVVDRSPVLQAVVLVVLVAIAAAPFYWLLNEHRRDRIIKTLLHARLGVLWVPAFLILAASVALTASSALLLVGADHRWWELLAPDDADPGSQVVDLEGIAEGALTSKLVLWELLDLAPIVEIPRTLAWEEPPLSYEDWGVGFVLLAFKGVAGVALLASGKAFFTARRGRDNSPSQRATDAGHEPAEDVVGSNATPPAEDRTRLRHTW